MNTRLLTEEKGSMKSYIYIYIYMQIPQCVCSQPSSRAISCFRTIRVGDILLTHVVRCLAALGVVLHKNIDTRNVKNAS